MKRLLVAMTAAWLVAGCGGATEDAPEEATEGSPAPTGEHADMDAPADAASSAPAAQVIPAGTEVTLSGTVGCGHCTYKIGTSCSTAMKAADGTVWVLDGIGADNPLFEDRFEGAEITMAGVVSYVDGVAHLTPNQEAVQDEM